MTAPTKPTSYWDAIPRGIGAGLLAWLGGAGIAFGFFVTHGLDGFENWLERLPSDPFYNDAGLGWGGAIAIWMLTAAAIRAGTLGGIGAAGSVAGSGVLLCAAIYVIEGAPLDPITAVVGTGLWILGVVVMIAARRSVDTAASRG